MADVRPPLPEPTGPPPTDGHPDIALRALLWETGTDPLSVVATAAEMTAADPSLTPDLGARGATELLAAAAHLRACPECQARSAYESAALGTALTAGEGIDPRPVERAVAAALEAFDPALLPAAARVEALDEQPAGGAGRRTAGAAPARSRLRTRRGERRSPAAGDRGVDAVGAGALGARRLTWRHVLAAFLVAAAVPVVPAVIRSMRIPPAPQSALSSGTSTTATAESLDAASPMAAGLDVPTSIVAVPAPVDGAPVDGAAGAAAPADGVAPSPVAASPTVASLFDDEPMAAAAVPPAVAPTIAAAPTIALAPSPAARSANAAAAGPAGAAAPAPEPLLDLGDLGTFATADALRATYAAKAPALRQALTSQPGAITFPAAATLPCLSAPGAPVRSGAHAVVGRRRAVVLETAFTSPDPAEVQRRLVVLDAATCTAIT